MKGLPAPVTPLPDPFKGGTLIFQTSSFPKGEPRGRTSTRPPAPHLPNPGAHPQALGSGCKTLTLQGQSMEAHSS